MDCKVLQHTTTDWWVVGVCVCVCVWAGVRRQQTWSFLVLFFLLSSERTLIFTSGPVSIIGGDGSGEGTRRGWDEGWGGIVERVMQRLLLCWFHPWLWTPVVLAPHYQHPHPSIHPGGHPASVWSVPCLGGDQGLTNDVYAVVLVDICWQNRSPVRHLEWN